MAEVIWTDPALIDLDAIGDYIALVSNLLGHLCEDAQVS